MLLTIAAVKDLEIEQLDVTTAFLNGILSEEIYMQQPTGFEDLEHPQRALRLHKALYGLKQAPRAWNETICKTLLEQGLKGSAADPCIFSIINEDKIMILALFVDDMIMAYDNKKFATEVKNALSENFKMKEMGELKYILGMQISRDRNNHLIYINQKQYITEILEKFSMSDCKPVSTPQEIDNSLGKIEYEKLNEEMHALYREAVGKLMFLMTSTRPDIAFTVGLLARQLSGPSEGHWKLVKRTLRYLQGTKALNLALGGPHEDIILKAYVDASWANDLEDRKSTSGCIVLICDSAVTWFSRKQTSVALSTTEAEYVAASSCVQEVLWARQLLDDIGFKQLMATKIMEDNQGCIKLAKNFRTDTRTKHIDIRHHFLRDKINSKEIEMVYCPTEDMAADVLTKALPGPQFTKLRETLGLAN